MKRSTLFLLFALLVASSCRKTTTTSNNVNADTASTKPHFQISGLTDVTLSNDYNEYTSIDISVQYLNSTQEGVTLALSGQPKGITFDTNWMSYGIPPYNTTIAVFDTTDVGIMPGSYPLTLTATTPSGYKQKYSFNLVVQHMPDIFTGKYNKCGSGCTTGTFSDSLYFDPVVLNKFWFSNFLNTGSSIFALVTLDRLLSTTISIPSQTINGSTYSGNGNFLASGHSLLLKVHKDADSCNLSLR